MEEQISIAIDIANEMREINNEKASSLVDKIVEGINISQYNSIDKCISIIISVREGKDVLSCGGSSQLITSQGYSEYDIYRLRLQAEGMCGEVLEELKQ